MRRLAALLLLAGCARAPSPGPSSLPAAEAEVSPADALARRVHAAAGGAALAQVARIDFDFVVRAEGVERFRARHTWDLVAGRDHARWRDREGVDHQVIVELATRTSTAGPVEAEKAHARWVNDAYWLMLPLKLLDPGVERTLEAPREHGGKRYEVLRLEFRGVGLTPKDRYWLFVDPTSARIERWEMVLEGQTAADRSGTSFADHQAVGPLTLALDHRSDDGKRQIAFEQVRVTTR